MAYTDRKSLPKNIKRFLGLRNEAQSRRTPMGEDGRSIALAASQNIDIDDEGGVISRPGYQIAVPGTNITSAYATRNYQALYYVDAGELMRLYPGLNAISLGTVPETDTYWVEVGNRIFMSSGYVVRDNTLLPWTVPVPAAPTVSATVGNLLAGQYQVVITTLMPDGRESGCSIATTVNIAADGGGIQLENVTGCNVYCTVENGDVFYLIGYQTNLIEDMHYYAYPLDKELLMTTALPAGIGPIAFYDSCMFFTLYDAAKHVTFIGWSKPFRFHVFDMFQEYIQVPGEVRLFAGLTDVLLIGTDKEILAYNGETITKVAFYGVPKGHSHAFPRDHDKYQVLFQTVRGVCAWPFENLSGDKFAFATGEYVGTGWVDMNGLEKFITLTDGTGLPDNSTIF